MEKHEKQGASLQFSADIFAHTRDIFLLRVGIIRQYIHVKPWLC